MLNLERNGSLRKQKTKQKNTDLNQSSHKTDRVPVLKSHRNRLNAFKQNTKLGFKELSHVTTSRLNVFHLLTFTGSGDRKDSGLTDSITAGRFLFSQPQSASKGRQPQSDKETRTEADRVEAP